METWEKILRHELEELVPDGLYTIGKGEFKTQTGKSGYIEYRIELCRALFFTNGLYSSITDKPTNDESSVVEKIEEYKSVSGIEMKDIYPESGFIIGE